MGLCSHLGIGHLTGGDQSLNVRAPLVASHAARAKSVNYLGSIGKPLTVGFFCFRIPRR